MTSTSKTTAPLDERRTGLTPSSARDSSAGNLALSHLRPRDVLSVGSVGMRTRRMRTALTALGVGIGIAALVSVMGISASSKADLLAQLDALGPNRLQVAPGNSFTPGSTPALADNALAMIRRIGPVTNASGITNVTATVLRNNLVDPNLTGGISVNATDQFLADAVGAKLASGHFLNAAQLGVPAIVLGATAAVRVGLSSTSPSARVYVSGEWFGVVGILQPIPLFPNLDTAAYIGRDIATARFKTASAPSLAFVVTVPSQVDAVQSVLAATVDPSAPGEVNVTRPSDAIAAKHAANNTLNALLLSLGGVALIVGGIGIANVMVISVLERRTEIGVRRALGATKRHIRAQFLVESVLLSTLGGVLGVVLGIAITVGYTHVRHIVLSIPLISVGAGLGAAIVVGALAGISPAARAARLAPADAIRPA